MTAKYKPTISFGYQAGIGIMLWKRLSIGIHYYGSTKTKINGTLKTSSEKWANPELKTNFNCGKLGMDLLAFRIGVHF
jgi:hypothetical protein